MTTRQCPSRQLIYSNYSIANKIDLCANNGPPDKPNRQVSYEEADLWAKEEGLLFLEASAKTGINVEEVRTEFFVIISASKRASFRLSIRRLAIYCTRYSKVSSTTKRYADLPFTNAYARLPPFSRVLIVRLFQSHGIKTARAANDPTQMTLEDSTRPKGTCC